MTSIKLPGDDLPDNLPLLTRVADENAPDDLPTLTEVVEKIQHAAPTKTILQSGDRHFSDGQAGLNETEMQRLLQRLETHLENVFAHQLNLSLEQLQRQAIEQAVNELKAELPELLRDALNVHPKL